MIHKKAFKTFNNNLIVNSYVENSDLQKSERNIYELHKDKINNSVFLDLGIGTGRTTRFFQPICKKYIGIDISPNMIFEAQKQTKNKECLFVGDARDLSFIEKGSIDVVLYSFNGLDYVGLSDRELILNQIYEVLKPGGLFVFSTHNIKSLKNNFSLKINRKEYNSHFIKEIILKLLFIFKFLLINNFKLFSLFFKTDYLTINDGVYNFSLTTMYVNLLSQESSLQEIGFKSIQLFDKQKGKRMTDTEKLKNIEPWIYFTCLK